MNSKDTIKQSKELYNKSIQLMDKNFKQLEQALVEKLMKPRDAGALEVHNSHASKDEQSTQSGSQEPSDILDAKQKY